MSIGENGRAVLDAARRATLPLLIAAPIAAAGSGTLAWCLLSGGPAAPEPAALASGAAALAAWAAAGILRERGLRRLAGEALRLAAGSGARDLAAARAALAELRELARELSLADAEAARETAALAGRAAEKLREAAGILAEIREKALAMAGGPPEEGGGGGPGPAA